MNSVVSSGSSGSVTRSATTRSPRDSAAEIASSVSRFTPPTGTIARDRRGRAVLGVLRFGVRTLIRG